MCVGVASISTDYCRRDKAVGVVLYRSNRSVLAVCMAIPGMVQILGDGSVSFSFLE